MKYPNLVLRHTTLSTLTHRVLLFFVETFHELLLG